MLLTGLDGSLKDQFTFDPRASKCYDLSAYSGSTTTEIEPLLAVDGTGEFLRYHRVFRSVDYDPCGGAAKR
jgi:hypothetical protein